MAYRDMNLTCERCEQVFPWPGWAQEWRVVTGKTQAPAACVACRTKAAPTGLASSASAPEPLWDGLPSRTVTRGGGEGDPINIALLGAREELLAAFSAIGARPADPLSLRDDLHLAEEAIHHGRYLSAPVSRLFLFGRVEDFAVEIELGSVASRMHARFWDSGRSDPVTGRNLWLGAVSLDIGIKLLRRHHIPVGTTHRIDRNLDAVRDLLVVALMEANQVEAATRRPGIGPTPNGRNGGGDPFFTGGDIVILVIAQSANQER